MIFAALSGLTLVGRVQPGQPLTRGSEPPGPSWQARDRLDGRFPGRSVVPLELPPLPSGAFKLAADLDTLKAVGSQLGGSCWNMHPKPVTRGSSRPRPAPRGGLLSFYGLYGIRLPLGPRRGCWLWGNLPTQQLNSRKGGWPRWGAQGSPPVSSPILL